MNRSDWFKGLLAAEVTQQLGEDSNDATTKYAMQALFSSRFGQGAFDYIKHVEANCGYTGEIKYVRELTIVDEILEFAALLGSKGCNPTLCELSYENYQQLQASDYFTLAHDAYTKRDYFTAFGLEIRLIIGSNRHHCEVY